MNKPIIFKGENIAKINEAIREAEGQARANLLDYNQLFDAIKRFQKDFNVSTYCAVFTLKELEGTVMHIAAATGKYEGRKASKYTKMTSLATLVFHNNKWYLSDIKRVEAPEYKVVIEFSEDAQKAIVRDRSRFYVI